MLRLIDQLLEVSARRELLQGGEERGTSLTSGSATGMDVAHVSRSRRGEFLSVALYGCETWSLILREQHTSKPRAIKNKAQRRIF
jgi:hypothetical protein